MKQHKLFITLTLNKIKLSLAAAWTTVFILVQAHFECISAINLHYTLGHDIYIGWITGCLAIGGGVVTICSSMGTPEDEEDNELDIEAVRQNHYKECFNV